MIDEIELVFDSCETITVGMAAVKSLRFTTSGERYEWDAKNNEFDKSHCMSDLHLEIDLGEGAPLRGGDRFAMEARGQTEREYIVERLSKTTDITSIYIAGEKYNVPWGEGGAYTNLWCRTFFNPQSKTVVYDMGSRYRNKMCFG